MKIRIHSPCGYIGLRHMQFPVEMEAHRIAYDGIAYVRFSVIMQQQGWVWNEWDALEGSDYTFLGSEYDVVESGIEMWDAMKQLTKGVEVDLDAPLEED